MTTEIHPGTGEPSNRQRAEWVREGLNSFAVQVSGHTFDNIADKGVEGDGPTVIQDFITDALHMAVQTLGMTPEQAQDLAERATRMFLEEHQMEADADAELAASAAPAGP